MKKIYYQVVENVLPQVYLLYNSFNNKFILLNNVRYEKYKKENILKYKLPHGIQTVGQLILNVLYCVGNAERKTVIYGFPVKTPEICGQQN